MNKKEIKDILQRHGYKMILPSWFLGDRKEKSVIFTAYDEMGTCYRFFVNWKGLESTHKPYATRQMLSGVCIHELTDVSSMFFEEVRA